MDMAMRPWRENSATSQSILYSLFEDKRFKAQLISLQFHIYELKPFPSYWKQIQNPNIYNKHPSSPLVHENHFSPGISEKSFRKQMLRKSRKTNDQEIHCQCVMVYFRMLPPGGATCPEDQTTDLVCFLETRWEGKPHTGWRKMAKKTDVLK